MREDLAQGIRPLHDWVVIEPRDAFRSQSDLLALPQAYDDDAHTSDGDLIREGNKLCCGIVRAVGPGWVNEECVRLEHDVEVGQRVMYDRASAERIDGTKPTLVRLRAYGVYLVLEDDNIEPVVGGLVTKKGP